jgi:hypothetical protein
MAEEFVLYIEKPIKIELAAPTLCVLSSVQEMSVYSSFRPRDNLVGHPSDPELQGQVKADIELRLYSVGVGSLRVQSAFQLRTLRCMVTVEGETAVDFQRVQAERVPMSLACQSACTNPTAFTGESGQTMGWESF